MTYEISYVIDLYFGLMVHDLITLDHDQRGIDKNLIKLSKCKDGSHER